MWQPYRPSRSVAFGMLPTVVWLALFLLGVALTVQLLWVLLSVALVFWLRRWG
jgi:hypothetical protein